MMKWETQLEEVSGERQHTDPDHLLQDHHRRSHYDTLSPPFIELPISSSEIQANDLEYGSLPCCRICLQHDPKYDHDLISPCMCNGSQKFVHRSCLDHWRSVEEHFAFSQCTSCKVQFHFKIVEVDQDGCSRRLNFGLFFAWNAFLVIFAINTAILALAFIAYLIFEDRLDLVQYNHPVLSYYAVGLFCLSVLLAIAALMHYCSNGDRSGPKCRDPVYNSNSDCSVDGECCCVLLGVFCAIIVILGLAYALLAAAMALQRIWQTQYQILIKRELTKEYIVEDLYGYYFSPRLALEHEKRLKRLKLLQIPELNELLDLSQRNGCRKC